MITRFLADPWSFHVLRQDAEGSSLDHLIYCPTSQQTKVLWESFALGCGCHSKSMSPNHSHVIMTVLQKAKAIKNTQTNLSSSKQKIIHQNINMGGGWKDGWVVNSTDCSSIGHRFNSQYPQGGSVDPVLGDLIPSHRRTGQNTNTHKIKLNLKKEKKNVNMEGQVVRMWLMFFLHLCKFSLLSKISKCHFK